MQLNPAEISELLKSKIQNLNVAADTRNQGSVVSVTDGICRVHGLSDVMQGEMIEFPGNTLDSRSTSSAIRWVRWFWAAMSTSSKAMS